MRSRRRSDPKATSSPKSISATRTDGAALLALYLPAWKQGFPLPQAFRTLDLITACVQGTGKTTAARMLHVVLPGATLSGAVHLPDKNEIPKKASFATLIAPAGDVCFDILQMANNLDSPSWRASSTTPMYEGPTARTVEGQ